MKTPLNPPLHLNDEEPRCVVLFHQGGAQPGQADHWDLMLEVENVLWTWRLEKLPVYNHVVLGERIADHRIQYLDFEGPISNNRGTVHQVRSGHYHWSMESANRIAILTFEKDSWKLNLGHENSIAKITRTIQ
ncbi:MAG: DNA polymerase ligase N-terminal domain-containing protein [Pirellulales bacterium]